jgi:hypothetical protein
MAKTRPSHAARQALIAQLSPSDRNRLLWWGISHAGERPKQALSWVASLRDIIESLQSTPTSAIASLFWLRLKNTLDEFRNAYAPQPLTPPDDPNDPHEANAYALDELYADLAADVYSECNNLLKVFTPDELLYIEWRRDCEAHVWADSYDLAPTNRGTLKDSREYSLLGTNVTHANLDAAKSRVTRGRSSVDVAVDLAGRAKPHVEAIIAAVEEMNAV